MTIGRLERGDPVVALAVLVRTLEVLNLVGDVDLVAKTDVLGSRLQDAYQKGPTRTRDRGLADLL